MPQDMVLVVGATGMLGHAVARQLRADGFLVRVLVRDLDRARARLGPDVAYVRGTVDDRAALTSALAGCSAVHISLASARPDEVDQVEHRGTARVVEVAAAQGVARVSYVSGMLVAEEFAGTIAQHRAKLRAEQAIYQHGVPYTIFKPTYFMDTLPRHVQGRVAIVLGRQPHAYHMVAARDFARMVSRALRTPDAANRHCVVHGPEAITMADALRLYCRVVEPGKRVITLPLWCMRVIDALVLGRKLQDTLQLMALMQRVGERGDPAETHRLLGAPTTTVREWCEHERRRRVQQGHAHAGDA